MIGRQRSINTVDFNKQGLREIQKTIRKGSGLAWNSKTPPMKLRVNIFEPGSNQKVIGR